MKRLLAFGAAVPLLAFVLGWLKGWSRGNSRASQSAAAPPHTILAGEPPFDGRLIPFRRGFSRYSVFFDPYILLLATVVAAVGAVFFAARTAEIAERQNEIQASQSLPVFYAERELTVQPDGDPDTDIFRIGSSGGMARNASIKVQPVMHMLWGGFHQTPGALRDIPLWAYERDYMAGEVEALWPSPVPFGATGNVADISDEMAWIMDRLVEETDADSVSGWVDWYMRIEYQDYQGNDRTEYYRFEAYGSLFTWSPQPVWTPTVEGVFRPMTTEQGERAFSQVAVNNRHNIAIYSGMTELEMELFVTRLIDEPTNTEQDQDSSLTPDASPVSRFPGKPVFVVDNSSRRLLYRSFPAS